jgi:hypothetical protein
VRLQHCGNSAEARTLDETADHVGAIAKPSSQPPQAAPLRADFIGDTCTAAGLTASGHAPALRLCRELITAGHDPTTVLHVYRGEVLALIVRTIGKGALFTVEDDRRGTPRLRRWRAR